MPAYQVKGFHKQICNILDDLAEGRRKKVMIFVPPQHGKLISHDTPILTTKGWTTHGKIKVGDYVFNQKGKPVKVTAISEDYFADRLVEFTDGSKIKCHHKHEWWVKKHHSKFQRIETDEMMGDGLWSGEKNKRGGRAIYKTHPNTLVDFDEKDLPLDPYVLGFWLGDGSTIKNCVTLHPDDYKVLDEIENKGFGEPKISTHKDTGILTAYFTPLYAILKKENLFDNKHIPEKYLISSKNQRLELLAGLIDSDGYVYQENGRVTFSNTDFNLIQQVKKLCVSLGFRVTISKFAPKTSSSGIKGKKNVYQLTFNPDLPIPTILERKKTTQISPQKRMRGIKNITKIDKVTGKCIEVEGGIYLVGENLIPTHNSEISSRRFPAYVLGKKPDTRIALCSYAAEHAQSFNRDCQRIVIDDKYSSVFPNTKIPDKNIATTSRHRYKRTANIFEVVGKNGFLKTVGVGGSLTGTTVDLGIIDDPFKDRQEAESATIRKRVWNWYTDVFETRLHNESRQLLLFTRWHEDDLAGRLLERDDDWDVIVFRALREDDPPNELGIKDNRKIDEALWEERHSVERLMKIRDESPRTFASLYQQRPAPLEGSILKREDFQIVDAIPRSAANEVTHFVVDGAYTKDTGNDPSGILGYRVSGNDIYLTAYKRVWCEFSELIEEISEFVDEYGNGKRSKIFIEPKASGLSVTQYLRKHSDLNAVKYKMTDGDKVGRLYGIEPMLQGKRVFLQRGIWNEQFINECLVFPNGKHDEAIDCLTMAVNQGLIRGSNKRKVHGYSRQNAPI